MSDTWLNIRFGDQHLQVRGWMFSFSKNSYHAGKPWWDIEVYEIRMPFKPNSDL